LTTGGPIYNYQPQRLVHNNSKKDEARIRFYTYISLHHGQWYLKNRVLGPTGTSTGTKYLKERRERMEEM
jgi:hypothetical protein